MSYYTELPDNLIQEIEKNNCILFIGGGISKKCITKGRKSLPNWYEFLKSFIFWHNRKFSFPGDYYEELKKLLKQEKYLLVAEELLDNIKDSEFKDFLDSSFDAKNILPSYLHKIISILPFRGIITTNYDNLIELSYIEYHKKIPKIITNNDVLNNKNPLDFPFFIFKMHGDIEDPKSIILSQGSYLNLIYNSPEYRNLIEKIFKNFTIIFIGYGRKDPDIESIIDKLFITSSSKKIHYMLSKEDSLTNIEKARLHKDRNIKVIEYVDYFGLHNHIDTFFTDVFNILHQKDVIKYQLPQKLRTRINVFYDKTDKEDGLFLWHYFFREGALTLCEEAQEEEYDRFLNSFDEYKDYIDFLVIFFGNNNITMRNKFIKKVVKIRDNINKYNFELLLVSLNRNKKVVKKMFPHEIKFFVRNDFIDYDLEKVKNHILDQL